MNERIAEALADRYRVEKEIGAGGMATVYLAHDVRHDRPVALKVLRPELSAILGGERFLAEIKTTANLQHPHILPLHDSGEVGGVVFYVMPLVEGESLRDRLSREGQLPVPDAVRLTREVAGALDYAHRHGVVHRDIKPENILLHEGQALVADFGIALAMSRSDGATRMTETGLSLGTPHYMSPEQAMGERSVDARTDVYALGCVLYEALTGEPPFTGPSAQAIIARVLAGEPDPVTTLRRTVPAHVAAAVHTAIQRLPADRFPTAAAFADALGNASFATTLAMPGAASPRSGIRHNRPALVLGAVAVLMAGAAAWGWLRPEPPAEVARYSILLPDGQSLGASQQSRIAMSPDGRVLVYVGEGRSGAPLMVRRRDQLTASSIGGSEGATNPFFSPDGRRVGFIHGSPRALRVAGLAGGPPTTITDSLVDQGGASWGRDGYIYYDGHLEGDGIARVRETGGRPEPVTMPDSTEQWHFQPEALPNGKGLLFTIASTGGQARTWRVGATRIGSLQHSALIEGRAPKYRDGYLFYVTVDGVLMAAPFDQNRLTLTGEAFPTAEGLSVRGLGRVDIAFSETGTLLYTSGSLATRNSELVWVSRTGQATPVDPDWVGRMSNFALSPDGGRVAFDVGEGGGRDVWVKPLDRSPASRISFGAPFNLHPAWMPDGKSIVFTARGGGPSNPPGLMLGPADGSVLPAAYRAGLLPSGTSVTSDGKWITYYTQSADIHAIRTEGDTAVVELVAQPSREFGVEVSPDGRWLAYMSDETGQFEIYVRPFPDTRLAKRAVTTGGGVAPRWSRDGRELFYLNADADDADLVAAQVLPGAAFAVGERRVLFNVEPYSIQLGDYAPSPDGSRFLMLRPVGALERPDELIVVENFLSDVRAKVKR